MWADAASEIAIKILNTMGITVSASGTEEDPGKNVKHTAELNRGILGSVWGKHQPTLCTKAFESTRVPGLDAYCRPAKRTG